MNLGLNFGNPAILAGPRYLAQAKALFARMTVPPSSARKKLINQTIGDFLDAGVYQKSDAIYMMAAHDAQAARLNWIDSVYNLSEVGSPSYTVDSGYQGNGSSSYLDTGASPSTLNSSGSAKFKQNSSHISCYVKNYASSVSTLIGCRNGTTSFVDITPTSSGLDCAFRPNSGPSGSVFSTPAPIGVNALMLANRDTSASTQAYRNGVSVGSTVLSSVSPPNFSMFVLAQNSGSAGSFTNAVAMAASFGESLTLAQVQDLSSIQQSYLSAVGAI